MSRDHTRRYARLLVEHGVGLRPDQRLFVRCERVHRELALAIAEAGYDLGACKVELWFTDPLERALFVRRGRPEEIAAYHEQDRSWFHDAVRTRSPLIHLVGEELPRLAAELARTHPEAWTSFVAGAREARRVFYEHGIGRRICPWLIAAAATEGWGREVFPRLRPRAAKQRLAELIFAFTFADRADGAERLADQSRRLRERARRLDELAISEIRVRGGGCDLRIGLSDRARWQPAGSRTVSGQAFRANLPSEEVFTTPDRRRTRGRLAASRPFRTPDGILVKDLVLRFRDGRVAAFDAGEGRPRSWLGGQAAK
jgi:aminopeptidase